MKTNKKITQTIKSISYSYNSIEVSLSGMNYAHFIHPKDVNWFPINKDGNSIKGTLSVGSTIVFDANISPKTRNLYDVEIKL